jgi:hypothetical protein
MRKNKLQILSLTLAISALPALSYANNWSGYRELNVVHIMNLNKLINLQLKILLRSQISVIHLQHHRRGIIINPTKIITTLTNIAQVSVLNIILRLTLSIHITERHL